MRITKKNKTIKNNKYNLTLNYKQIFDYKS